jgi:hypothetical protein
MAQDIPYDGVNNFPPEVERIAKDIQKLNVMDCKAPHYTRTRGKCV